MFQLFDDVYDRSFSTANAADMDINYLVGNWAIGTTEQKCAAAESERFVFRKNGTFEASRSNKAEAVGFWRIAGDMVRLISSLPVVFSRISMPN